MFINYDKEAERNLLEIKRKKLFRDYPLISSIAENAPYGINEKNGNKVIIWGNNNYLGLSTHSKVIAAKINTVKKSGTSSGGTRNVLGTSKILNDLEMKIASWHGKEKALVHISALDANIGVLGALGRIFKNAVFLSDENNHASIIDGIRISAASKYIFKHNDIAGLENKLKEIRTASDERPIIIVVESVYSMSGDKAKLKEIVELKNKYNALLYLDEVHAIGIFGKRGTGLAEELGLLDDIDLICGTLGKSVGSAGGYVTGSTDMIEFLRHNSRNFIYTTALSPDTAAAALAAINIIDSAEGTELRDKHKKVIREFKKVLKKHNIEFLNNEAHIVPIIIGDEQRTSLIASDLLNEYNIAVTPLFAPTVPIGSARLRVNPTPNHTKEMAEEFGAALSTLFKKYSDTKLVANTNEEAKLKNKSRGRK